VRDFVYPSKPRPGDRVAVVSPSAGLPAVFPDVYELGLRRLREVFALEPVEYPTTRVLGAPARDRADDLHAAFADPTITAVLATIGGDDQITVLRHLDPDLLRAHPKPFYGYSDNTNLLNFLWRQGVVGYYGGSVMVHLGRGGALHPMSAASLRAALFTHDEVDLAVPAEFGDEPGFWGEPGALDAEPPMRPADGWMWAGATDRVVEGASWGGNIEVLSWLLMADLVDALPAYDGTVLLAETSEELPAAAEVYRILRSIGERGLLGRFAAILVGRAKAWDFTRRLTLDERHTYAAEQRSAVLRACADYAPDAIVVLDVDFGHTDPQLIVPYGGTIRVDGRARRITVRY
jgi:muramoyltetrapeptide carboxypeptidase LdcA involved in peptidoglycan recycling